MTISPTSSYTASSVQAQALSDSSSNSIGDALLNLLSQSQTTPNQDDTSVFSALENQGSSQQAASTALQGASAYTSTASGYLGEIAGILQSMDKLVGSTDSSSSAQFSSLQSELRSIVGGSTSDIGGTSDVDSPSGSYDGTALFGSSGGMSVATGDQADPSITVPNTNLQTGAFASLITQDSSGAYTLSAGGSGTAAAIKSALAQVSAAQQSISGASTRLSASTIALDVGSENLASYLSTSTEASSATNWAQSLIQNQPAQALSAQSGSVSSSLLSLLDS